MRTSRIARSAIRRPAVAVSAASIATVLLAAGFTTPAQAADGTDDPAKALHLGAKEKLIPRGVITDPDGTVHTRYERTYDGLPVLGGDVVVHQAKKNGEIEDVDKATEATIKVPTTKAKIAPPVAEKSAMSFAKSTDKGGKFAKDKAPRKIIWAAQGKPVLAYETVVGGLQHDGTPSQLHVVTDAATGAKLYEYQAIETGTGTSEYSGRVKVGSVKIGKLYYLRDNPRGGQQVYNAQHREDGTFPPFSNSRDTWGNGKPTMAQTAAVDAQYGAATTWDYYKNVFGRKGIKGDGKAARSFVHYSNGYDNAFWNDDCFCMVYGDGKDNKHPLTSLDIAGHEMTHGVTSATANLRYSGESGGLNEATSDIFGTAVEFYAKNKTAPGNYFLGEKLGRPIRYMDKPSKDGDSPDAWNSRLGQLDPHYSSGVGNHFYYLLAEGSGRKSINGFQYNSPTANGKKVTGIGRDAAQKIWYKALTTYMTSTTDYKGARSATLKAAKALYGTKSKQYKTVQAAWDAVNVK